MKQIEVLSTLASCAASYSADTISKWSSQIWDSLKFEIWNGENEDFILGALEVLRAMTVSLGRSHYDWSSTDSATAKFVIPAATECKGRFHDSKKQYMVSSGKILHGIASGSPYAFHLVAMTVLPDMHVIWQDLKLPSEKKMLLEVYNYILAARLAQPVIIPAHSQSALQIAPLIESFDRFRDGIVEVYFDAVSNIRQETPSSSIPFGVPAVQGLVLLFQVPSYLSAVEQGIIVQELNTILFSPPKDDDIRIAVLSSLQNISAAEPMTFQDITLMNFFEKLPDSLSRDEEERKTELEVVIGHLQDLVQITCYGPCQKELPDGPPVNDSSSYWHRNFDAMEKKLLKRLDLILQQSDNWDYANTILAAICGGLQIFDINLNLARTVSQEPMPLDLQVGPYTYIVMHLFRKVVELKDYPSGPLGGFELRYTGIKKPFDEKFVQMVGRTAMWALRSDLTTPANNFLLNWNALFPNEPSAIWTLFAPGPYPKSLNISQQNLESGPKDKCLANALSMYLLAGNRRTESPIVAEVRSFVHECLIC
jgi:DNA repair/transcription protein MET18/MMS19